MSRDLHIPPCKHILFPGTSIISFILHCHTCRLEKDYVVEKHLGKGGFGVVHHVKRRPDRGEYALKIIKLSSK